MTVRSDNAAINAVESFGYDNFNPGQAASDWGLIINDDTSTFRINTTTGAIGLPFGSIVESGNTITGTANVTIGAYNLTLTREYSLLTTTGFSVTTTVTNNGTPISFIRVFDTFDPDIGADANGNFLNSNDVLTQDGVLIGRTSDGTALGPYTVGLGVTDPRAVVSAGSPTFITSAASLLATVASPSDDDGASTTQGHLDVIFTDALGSGSTTSFKYYMGYGTTLAGGISALLAAVDASITCAVSSNDDTCTVNAATDQSISVNALAGTDTLVLGGTTNYSFDISKFGTTYSSFEDLRKAGPSTVTLTGLAGFSGLGVDIQGGTLVASTGQLGATGAVTIASGSQLSVTSDLEIGSLAGAGSVALQNADLTVGGNGASTTFAGVIAGNGGLAKTGTGAFILSGVNTYSGLTFIDAGTLTLSGGSALPDSADVIIADAGTLSVSSSETISAFTGSGAINLQSPAALTVGGDGASFDYSGSISGGGSLVKAGTGELILTGDTSLSGQLDVQGGVLALSNGGLLSNASLSVGSGATTLFGALFPGLNGTGAVGSTLGPISVAGGATLYLDDDSVLNGSSLNLAPGSNLQAFFTTDTTKHAQINLTGPATLSGAKFGAFLDPMTFSNTDKTQFVYTDVITASSVTGTFAEANVLQAPNDIFSADVTYKPNGVDIKINRGSFGDVGDSSNQKGVGQTLENIFKNGTSDLDLQNLFFILANSTNDAIGAIYNALAGSSEADTRDSSKNGNSSYEDSVDTRTNMARSAGCTVAGPIWCFRRYAMAEPLVKSDVQGDPTAFEWLDTGLRNRGSTSFWGRAVGGWTKTNGDANATGSRQWIGGLIIGADRVINSNLLVGVAGQVSETSVNFTSSPNSSDVFSAQLGTYFSYGGPNAYVNGYISVTGSQADAERHFAVGSKIYDAKSSARSWTYATSLEFGTILERGLFRIEPNGSITGSFGQAKKYTETGAAGLSLIIDPEDSQSLRTAIGVRLSRVIRSEDRKIVPEVRLAWVHEWLDRRQVFAAAFAAAPQFPFIVEGQTFARDFVSLGLGLTLPLMPNVTGYFDAQGLCSRDTTSAFVSAGLRATW